MSIQTPNSKKRKLNGMRSWVWKYYISDNSHDESALSPTSPRCLLCQKPVKMYGASTTQLINHLRTHDVFESTRIETVMANQTNQTASALYDDEYDCDFIDSDVSHSSNDNTPYCQRKIKRIEDKLLRFIVANNLPFAIVESTEFQSLLNEFSRQYKLPCRQTVRNTWLPEKVLIINCILFIYNHHKIRNK